MAKTHARTHKKKQKKQNLPSNKVERATDLFRPILLSGWMGLLLVLPFLRAQTFTVYSAPKFFVSLIIIIFLSAVVIIGLIQNRLQRPRIFWAKAVLLYTLVFALAIIFSVNRHASIFGNHPDFHTGVIPYLLCLSFFYIVLISRPTIDLLRRFLQGLSLTGIIVGVQAVFERYGLLHVGNPIAVKFGRAVGMLGNSDYTLSYLLFMLPLIVYFFTQERQKVVRNLYGLAIGITLFGMFLLSPSTIQTMVSGIVQSARGLTGVGVLVALCCIAYPHKGRIHAAAGKIGYGKIGLIGMGLLFLLVLLFHQSVKKPVLAFIHSTPNEQRFFGWQAGLKIGKEHLLIGSGPATVSYFLPAIQKEAPSAGWEYDSSTDNLHNAAIDKFATMGIPGVVGYLLLWGSLFAYIIKKIRQNTPEKKFLIAVGTSLALFIGFNQFFFSTTGTMLLPWLGAAVAFTITDEVAYVSAKVSKPILQVTGVGLTALVAVFLLFWGFRYWMADYYYGKASQKVENFAYAGKATRLFPFIDSYWRMYGYNLYYYSFVYNPKVNNLVLKDSDKEVALLESSRATKRAVEIQPKSSANWITYGSVLLPMQAIDQKNKAEASQAFSTALALEANNNPLTYLKVAAAYESLDDFDTEKIYLDQANALSTIKPEPINYRQIKYQVAAKYGDMYYRQKDSRAALEKYQEALQYISSDQDSERDAINARIAELKGT